MHSPAGAGWDRGLTPPAAAGWAGVLPALRRPAGGAPVGRLVARSTMMPSVHIFAQELIRQERLLPSGSVFMIIP